MTLTSYIVSQDVEEISTSASFSGNWHCW